MLAKEKKLVFKKQVKILLFALMFIFGAIAVYFLYIYYNPKEIISNRYNYKIDRNIDYKVHLKENEFYEDEFLASNQQYTAELMDYVDVDFSYIYTGSDLANFNYDYTIDATIIGEYENTDSATPELWKKKYNIAEEKISLDESKSGFNVLENVKINYDSYNTVVNDFRTRFKLAILAHLNVKLNIKYNGILKESGKELNGTDTMEINIPLSRTTVAIDTDYDKETSKNVDLKSLEDSNKMFLYIGLLIGVLDILVFIILFDKMVAANKTPYTKKLEKILKDYSDITIKILNGISFDDKEIIEITSFNDMLDIEEEFNSPIMVYERIKHKETWFIVVNNDYAYRYILNIYNAEE